MPEEVLKIMEIKQIELVFANPKKVKIRYGGIEDGIKEQVTSINIAEYPKGTFIMMNYKTEKGESLIATDLKSIKELIVLD